MKETFKDIPGYEGLYQVSDRGRVKSFHKSDAKILNPLNHSEGYLYVNLCKDKKRRYVAIHQLMAMAFLNHKPNGSKMVIDHVDNDKTNNLLSNIRIISNRGNVSRGYKNKTSKHTGVHFDRTQGKWISRIMYKKESIYIGIYPTEEEAYLARKNKEKELGL